MERVTGVELLVRSSWNRGVDSAYRYLRETLEAALVLGSVEVSVPHRPDGEAIKWLLLKTVRAPGLIDAIERVHWYTCRLND
jgi:hypothetical protein